MLEQFPPQGLTARWRRPVGLGFSSPIVAQGRVFVSDASLSNPKVLERIYCLDATSGERVWVYSCETGHPDWIFMAGQERGPGATPIAQDGRLYVLGMFGQLMSLNASNGELLWSHNLRQTFQLRDFPTDSSPLIERDKLIVFIGGKPGASVVAFDRISGRELWRALDEESTHSSPMVTVAGGNRQLIVWTQRSIAAIDPGDGHVYWREPLPTSADYAVATPVIKDHRLCVSGLMMQLDSEQPGTRVLWPESRALSRRVLSNTSTPMLLGNVLFSAASSGELLAVEWGTGKELWKTNGVTSLLSGASVHLTEHGNGVLLFTDEGNLIRAQLTAEGYRENSRARLIEPTWPFAGRNVAWAAPAFANRHVYARNDKELVCVSLALEP